MDMRFYWICDRTKQGMFRVLWEKDVVNLADCFTKHHLPAHHIKMRPTYLHVAKQTLSTGTECEGVLIQHSGLNQSLVPCHQGTAKSPVPGSCECDDKRVT